MTTCPHGSATPCHCMWCMADALTKEQAAIEAIRRLIRDNEAQVEAILDRMPHTGEAKP